MNKRCLSLLLFGVLLFNVIGHPGVIQAEELFEADSGIARKFYYNQYLSDGRLDLSCYDYNVSTHTSQSSWTGVRWHNYFEMAQNYWNRSTTSFSSYTPPGNIVSCRSAGSAHVWYAIPLQTKWEEYTGMQYLTCRALTKVYDMAGTEITDTNVVSVGNMIRSGNIYFNPSLSSHVVTEINNTTNAAACTIAPELGHVLGFGHLLYNVNSIMESGTKSYGELQAYDLAKLRSKYIDD